ncbi:ABC transporter ATP-binding protein [Polymorphobacter sp.]|uniref:ABC transporter ATP-binding protein n=1 Tax=Polymorphobacter sp. TaxID=1909290 RepID=UPI003F6F0B8B
MTGLVMENLVVHGGDHALVQGVSLSVPRGTVMGLVGESGSGKSMTVMSIPRLLPAGCTIAAGRIAIDGENLASLPDSAMPALRGSRIGVIFQDPFASLNPVRRIGDLLAEVIIRHQKLPRAEAAAAAIAALDEVGLPDPAAKARAYPHEMSGGQRQRVGIALALANHPGLVIADEPTTALDPTVQVHILDLLRRRTRDAAAILVTHDLGAAAYLCTRIAVMYSGRIVEQASPADLVHRPRHPYTAALLAAAPRLTTSQRRTAAIPGQPPAPGERPPGCAFAPRCAAAGPECTTVPPLTGTDHQVACHRPLA